jgi:hypothetical protein
MKNEHDNLEAELHALRPQAMSPELQERIAASLAIDRTAILRRKLRERVALLGGLIAASLLIAVLWPQSHRGPMPDPSTTTPIIEVADPLPTFRAYQHALAQSAEAVEALADKYAALTLAANYSSKRLRALPLTSADLPD